MKYFATVFLSLLLLYPAYSQTAKSTAAAKKPVSSKPAAPKPENNGSTATAKPKPESTPRKAADENAAYEKASAIAGPAERVTALRKFLLDFPKTEKLNKVQEQLAADQTLMANEKLQAKDPAAAASLFVSAVADAPRPVADQFVAEIAAKTLPALFWAGERVGAFGVAKALEEKCSDSTAQLLEIANFYMSVENGSEARRIADAAIKLNPASVAAYQTLGLANRIDFRLDDSAAAYAKALEFDPASMAARRGLAEIRRSQGRSDDAAGLYREILAGDDTNLPARTGLILALFESGKRADAEVELSRSLEASPNNIMLMACAAYWYAAQKDGQKAIEYAQKAIAVDPRFIWSHIALARGLMTEKRPLDAERSLMAARRYGNFPTLEYEIASARLMAGFYREAAEELQKSFAVKDGKVTTRLGGRVDAEADDLITLISRERQASIFAPVAADSAENARQLRSLLDLTTKIAADDDDAVARAATEFASGDDRMLVYRQLFAARELLDHKRALAVATDIAKGAVGRDDEGLEVAVPAAAVLADELYDSRKLAASRDEYLRSPDVPKQTLSAILRGRIEEINGWALYQANDPAQSAVRLRRAVSVLPPDSSWWRSSMWRLGAALDADGKASEALDAYIKSYKSGQPDGVRYSVIKTLYARVKGSTDGLEDKVGADPTPIAANQPDASKAVTEKPAETSSVAVTSAAKTPTIGEVPNVPAASPTPSETPKPVEPEPSPTPADIVPVPSPMPETQTAAPGNVIPAAVPESTPETVAKTDEPVTKTVISEKTVPDPTPRPSPETVAKVDEPAADVKMTAKVEPLPTPTPEKAINVEPNPETNVPEKQEPKKPGDEPAAKLVEKEPQPIPIAKELFPPVIIEIPPPVKIGQTKSDVPTEPKAAITNEEKPPESKPAETPATISPCSIGLSEERLTLQNSGGDLAVIVGTADDIELTGLKATSNSPQDVSVRLEPIAGVKGRALYIVRSVSRKTGEFQIVFELPCGKRELPVTVR